MRGKRARDDAGVVGRLGRSPGAVLVLLLIAAAAALLPAYLALVNVQRSGVDGVARTLGRQSGERIARVIVEPEIRSGRVTAADRARVASVLRSTPHLLRARLWDAEGRLAASTRPRESRALRPDEHVLDALETGRTGDVIWTRGDDVIAVQAPVRRASGAKAGVLEVHFDYEPARAEIAGGTNTIKWILALVALAVYAALLPLLRRSARVLSQLHRERHPALEGELRDAMRRGELRLHYQPKLELRTGRIPCVEALVRWQSPRRGPMSPGDFLPQIEETDLIDELTAHVAGLAAAQLGAWAAAGLELDVAINVSPRTLANADLPDQLAAILLGHGVDPQRMILELTETAVMERPETQRRTLDALAARGFRLSIDDFGTGRSSLQRLDRLPVDELKIDRSFIARLEETGDPTLVCAMIRLGHDLGMLVVAEGAESRRAVEQLREFACDLVQGYAISRPLPPAELRVWLDARAERSRRVTRVQDAKPGKIIDKGGQQRGE